MRIPNEKLEALKRDYSELAREYFRFTVIKAQRHDEWDELSERFPNTDIDALIFLLDGSLAWLSLCRWHLLDDLGIVDTQVNRGKLSHCLESGLPFETFLNMVQGM